MSLQQVVKALKGRAIDHAFVRSGQLIIVLTHGVDCAAVIIEAENASESPYPEDCEPGLVGSVMSAAVIGDLLKIVDAEERIRCMERDLDAKRESLNRERTMFNERVERRNDENDQ